MSSRAEFTLDVDRAKLRKRLENVRAMRRRAEDLTPAWDALLTWFSEQVFQQFLTRGGRFGKPWAPLASRTLRDKFKGGYPLDPLIRTGELVQDISSRPLGVENMTPSSVTAGTDVWYGRFHMTGTERMPARPMWDARQIREEQAATSAAYAWIVRAERAVLPREQLRRGVG